MATPEHLEILKQGVETWNSWRKKNPSIRPDLSEAQLDSETLYVLNLSGADLRGANLRRKDLLGADVSGADLAGADLSGANLDLTIGLTQEQVNSARADEHTRLPEDIQLPAHWTKTM